MTDQPTAVDGIVHIRSTTDDAGRAACLLQWGPIHTLLDPQVVLTTARDLLAAAAGAENDIAMINAFRSDLGTADDILGAILTAVRRRRPAPHGTTGLRIEAVAGARTGLPLVHIARGSMKGELTPDEARDMALAWTQTAVAAQIDVRLRYALGEWDHLTPAEIAQLFTLIQQAQR